MQKPNDQSPIPLPLWTEDPPPAGYTYFGQFIDHNLTEDDTAVRDAGQRPPWETPNYRGPWLNLSGVYSEPHNRGRWKELYRDDGVSFRLGKPELSNGEQFDVPLGSNGYPILTDDRNNENVIVRQIHAVFLKLHNLAIQELLVEEPTLPSWKLFARARERVQWQYQYLVRHDFLGKVCKASVFKELVLDNGQPRIDWATDGFSIPVEFSQAALRFGHSLVRPHYRLNVSSGQVPLSALLCGGERRALKPIEAVHWSSFLSGFGEKAMRIDTGIASPLFGLESKDIHLYVSTPAPHPPFALPERTLVRGAKNKLPSGQFVGNAFGLPPLHAEQETVEGITYDPGKELRTCGLEEDTPLWYYLLLEAEVDKETRGGKLGELGSRLLIETINGALREDPDSYIRRFGAGWEPPIWKRAKVQVKSLLDLVQLLRLTP